MQVLEAAAVSATARQPAPLPLPHRMRQPMAAGVSAFAFQGTNAHVLLGVAEPVRT